jgi:DNA-binding NarL/FixJ family response regulator
VIRLLLVDDHAVVREGYRRLLERRGDLQICGEAGDAQTALTLFRDDRPDVVVADLALPDMGGIEMIQRMVQRDPDARVLAFSMHRDPLFASQALKAGALGYVTKSSPPDVLVQAVYRVAAGERTLSPDIAPEIALQLIDGGNDPVAALTPREFEVLRLLLQGMRPEAIGEALHISPKTVQNTHYQIKVRLGVKTDIELVKLAVRHGLVSG